MNVRGVLYNQVPVIETWRPKVPRGLPGRLSALVYLFRTFPHLFSRKKNPQSRSDRRIDYSTTLLSQSSGGGACNIQSGGSARTSKRLFFQTFTTQQHRTPVIKGPRFRSDSSLERSKGSIIKIISQKLLLLRKRAIFDVLPRLIAPKSPEDGTTLL